MRRKMLRTAGILALSLALSAGMAGCAEKGDGEPGTSGIQSVTLQDSDGAGSSSGIEAGSGENSEPDAPDSQSAGLNHGGGEGDGSGKGSGEAESKKETGKEIGDCANEEDNTKSVYFEGADLNGRVLEFSDTGFTMTPVHTVIYEDGSSDSWEAAPGKEKEEDNIYVTYREDTVFEVVYFSMALQKVSSRGEAKKDDVKKQTMVYVFGSSEDEKNWTADKILIQKWD